MAQENNQKAGVIILDKPAGISSAKAIAILKNRLKLKKIGHAGTLDPMATGLLICLINGATKLADLALAGDKVYSGKFLLGRVTTTDDIEGEIISETDVIPSFDTVKEAALSLSGSVLQIPPQVSAVKKNGVRAYKLARKGKQVEIAARRVTIYSMDLSESGDPKIIGFRIKCSKGTYIRSIARDLGEKLGCGACMAALRREVSLPFDISAGKPPEEISETDILDWWQLLPHASRLQFDDDTAQRLSLGNEDLLNTLSVDFPDAELLIYGSKSKWLGVLRKDPGGIWKFAVNMS